MTTIAKCSNTSKSSNGNTSKPPEKIKMSNALKVYEAICNVTSDMSREGIAKNNRNQQQGYNFRGIDDVYNALSPLLAKHKLVVIPRMMKRESTERTTSKGGAIFYTVVEAEFDFVSAEDGSRHTARTFGEAMDSADKSTNKAMSAAYKYAAFQTFAIPTEGDNDADATTHQVAPTVSEADAKAHVDAIKKATTGDALRAAFHTAKAAAEAVNDRPAFERFVTAKNERVAEMQAAAAQKAAETQPA